MSSSESKATPKKASAAPAANALATSALGASAPASKGSKPCKSIRTWTLPKEAKVRVGASVYLKGCEDRGVWGTIQELGLPIDDDLAKISSKELKEVAKAENCGFLLDKRGPQYAQLDFVWNEKDRTFRELSAREVSKIRKLSAPRDWSKIHECCNRDEKGLRVFQNDAAFFVHGNLDLHKNKVTDFDAAKIRKIQKKKSADSEDTDAEEDTSSKKSKGKKRKAEEEEAEEEEEEENGNEAEEASQKPVKKKPRNKRKKEEEEEEEVLDDEALVELAKKVFRVKKKLRNQLKNRSSVPPMVLACIF